MGHDLLTAIALVLIIEGLMPSIAPASWQRYLAEIAKMNPRTIRGAGIVAMIGGALLLQFLN